MTLVTLLAAGLWLHWYAKTQRTSLAYVIRCIYLHRDIGNGKLYGAGLVDFIVPGLFFGAGLGVAAKYWPAKWVVLCVIIGSLGLALVPAIYDAFAGAFLSSGEATPLSGMILGYIKMLSWCGSISYMVRGGLRHSKINVGE